MIQEDRFFARHVGKRVLLDSNLLLVFLTGSFDEQLFGRFKRVSAYSIEDYRLLIRVLGYFRVLITTPHILTEVSNLANSLPERIKPDWHRSFGALLAAQDRFPNFLERWIPALQLAITPEFSAFGLTDAGVSALSAEALVVTEDYRLSGALRQRGLSVLNFEDLRKLSKAVGFDPE